MELSNEFEVPVPIERAWAILTDLERIAPCMPGAQLQEVEGNKYRGIVKVKVGPITAQYKGQATIVDKDDDAHRILIEATGRDTRGAGNATANISAELEAKGDRTHVSVLTDLTVTGKVAQFGRGVLGDVSAKLLDQFVDNLESTVLADELVGEAVEFEKIAAASDDPDVTDSATRSAEAALDTAVEVEAALDQSAPREPAEEPAVRVIDSAPVAPVDLFETAGSPVLKRALPLIVVIGAVLVLLGLRRRRRRAR